MSNDELMWRGKYLEVRRDGTWEYTARVGGTGAAVILATTAAGEVVLVEQLRRAFGRTTIELPAGLIGDDGNNDAAAAARRELEEETGFASGDWAEIGEFATSPGMSAEMFTLFRARDCVRNSAGGGIDDEDITVHVVPLAGIGGWLDARRVAGLVIDCRLVALLGLA
ncbi:MAG: NUDIX hydrolase [Janthinobacterium lividum]